MANRIEYPIQEAHKEHIARTQHVLEWLQSERARLSDELRMVSQRGQALQGELLAFIGEHYQIPAGTAITFDSARGVLSTPIAPQDDQGKDDDQGDDQGTGDDQQA